MSDYDSWLTGGFAPGFYLCDRCGDKCDWLSKRGECCNCNEERLYFLKEPNDDDLESL